MKYAGKTFTLYASQPVAIQGSDSLYTYQNTGTGTATIVGSNNAVNWTTVATVTSGASHTGSHAYAFLMMTGSTEVSVSRGAAGDNSFSSSNPLPAKSVNCVIASDGVLLPVDSLEQTLTYIGDLISTISVSFGSEVYIQTYTYTSSNVTSISQWEKQ